MVIDAAMRARISTWKNAGPALPKPRQCSKPSNITVRLCKQDDRSSAAGMIAAELIRNGALGEVTLVNTSTYRNRPRGKMNGAGMERIRTLSVLKRAWSRKIWTGSDSRQCSLPPFSMERFWHWRCYWDYGTGISGDLLSHSFIRAIHSQYRVPLAASPPGSMLPS